MGDTWWPTADGGLEYYQHTDERAPFRWSPFRCNEVMRDRPWSVIEDFHDRVAAGEASLADLTPICESSCDLDGPEALELSDNLDDSEASGNTSNGLNDCGKSGEGNDSDGYGSSERRALFRLNRDSDGETAVGQSTNFNAFRSSDHSAVVNGCRLSVVDSGESNGREASLESEISEGLSPSIESVDRDGFGPSVSCKGSDGYGPFSANPGDPNDERVLVGSENGLAASVSCKEPIGCGPFVVSNALADCRWAFVEPTYSNGVAPSVRTEVSDGGGGPAEGATPVLGKRCERRTFKIELAYSGRHFWGWQRQTGHETVQDSLERALRSVLNAHEGRNGTAMDGTPSKYSTNATVAGRTDRGVSAAGQVVSWYTRCPDVDCEGIADAINREAAGRLRAVHVSQVSRSFHAQFSAKWRHYVYLFPLKGGEVQAGGLLRMQPPGAAAPHQPRGTVNAIPPSVFSVRLLDGMLRQLAGRSISYGGFARDTRADRSSGQHVVCHLFKARADVVTVTSPRQAPRALRPALRFSLVGNRFLHRVRMWR